MLKLMNGGTSKQVDHYPNITYVSFQTIATQWRARDVGYRRNP